MTTTSDAHGSTFELDHGSRAIFEDAVERLFERAPRFADRLWAARPFGSATAFLGRAREIAHSMPEDERIELVNAHPRLGAPAATMSIASIGEQGYDRTANTAEVDVGTRLERLNDDYERAFGFRYCVFVAGRSRAELVPEFERALNGNCDEELDRAIDAVVDIAADRLRKMGDR
jgi:2-oxo-4-hydroxy-4-carboxy-5-ureidoimidazoline decarboxylase